MNDFNKALDEYIERNIDQHDFNYWGEAEEYRNGARLLKPIVLDLAECLKYYSEIEKHNFYEFIPHNYAEKLGLKAKNALNSLKEKIKG